MTPEAPVSGAAPASPAAGILVPTGLGKRAGRIYEQLKRQSS